MPNSASLARVLAVSAALLGLSACASGDPMSYIPATQRALLQAQAQLGSSEHVGRGGSGGSSVAAMLERARGEGGGSSSAGGAVPSGAARIVFADGQVQPDQAQREEIMRVAAASRAAGGATVVARKDDLTAQRRAVAVAMLMGAVDPEVRYEEGVPASQVLVAAGPGGRAQ